MPRLAFCISVLFVIADWGACRDAPQSMVEKALVDGQRIVLDKQNHSPPKRGRLSKGSRLHNGNQAASSLTIAHQARADTLIEATKLINDQCQNCTTFDMPFTSMFNGLESASRTFCSVSSKYRTQDGQCNNLRQMQLGSTATPFRRILEPAYDDGLNTPRSRALDGSPLPSARLVSRTVHQTVSATDSQHTHMVMQWGQFLDHDITLTPVATGPGGTPFDCFECNSATTVSDTCFPIPVPPNDNDIPDACMEFARSAPGQITLGPREQTNQITAFIDASNVYGSEVEKARSLRSFSGGLMRVNHRANNYDLLPPKTNDSGCDAPPSTPCFDAGDIRNSEQPGLASMHTVWLREHNSIASSLATINPNWNDEQLYLESRRIVGALHQHIAYNEFLREVLGDTLLRANGLEPRAAGYSNIYDQNCDPSIANEFATAAYRFGHSMIDGALRLVKDVSKTTLPLQQSFFNPSYLYGTQNIDKVLMGFVSQRCQAVDRFVSDSVRNHLLDDFLDLSALNIQRGRDHGLQPWWRYREHYNLPIPFSFTDQTMLSITDRDNEAIKALDDVYKHPKDVDVYTGILIEKPRNGAMLGETGAKILMDQFSRLKKCDRFYYENGGQAGSFTPAQLSSIKSVRLSHVLCRQLSLVTTMQPNAFRMPDTGSNRIQSCSTYPAMDLTAWRDETSSRPGPQRPPPNGPRPQPSGKGGGRPPPRRPPPSGGRRPPSRGPRGSPNNRPPPPIPGSNRRPSGDPRRDQIRDLMRVYRKHNLL